MKAAEATYETLRKEAAAGETLEQVDRLAQPGAAVARRKERIQTLQIERGRLSAAIQVQESDGLEEKIARLRGDRERQFFERESKVLPLLGRTLAETERQVRERYLVPIPSVSSLTPRRSSPAQRVDSAEAGSTCGGDFGPRFSGRQRPRIGVEHWGARSPEPPPAPHDEAQGTAEFRRFPH